MSGLNRYFLMFASAYACVAVYFLLNKYALQSATIPHIVTSEAVLADNILSLRGTVAINAPLHTEPPTILASKTALVHPVHIAQQQHQHEEAKADEEEEVDTVTDIVSDVVKCFTTHGQLIIDVRKAWAPIGATRFVELVDAGHFTDLPFYRVCPKYLTQFGKRYFSDDQFDADSLMQLKDDISLRGQRDMDYGYLFFATNEENSRKAEMAISFCDMINCDVTGLGHKAWEVPVATIRHGYFDTLNKIMLTGFPFPKLEISGMDGNGPNVEKLQEDKHYLKETFPDLAYFQSCKVVQRNTKVTRAVFDDHPASVQKRKKISSKSASISGDSIDKISHDQQLHENEPSKLSEELSADIADDDDEVEEKSLKEYLLGGESREQRLGGKDSMSIGDSAVAVAEVSTPPVVAAAVPKLKPPPLPSGLSGSKPFKVVFSIRSGTGEALGDIIVEIEPDWAPLGSKRFQDLVTAQFFDDCRFFRAIKGFVSQFGIPAIPLSKTHPWARLPIPDDKIATSNTRGVLTFASSGKNSRSNQLFFNLHDNAYLDQQGFSPIGKIISGIDVLDKIYTGYGDKPNQGKINNLGNSYLIESFPELTYMESVRIL